MTDYAAATVAERRASDGYCTTCGGVTSERAPFDGEDYCHGHPVTSPVASVASVASIAGDAPGPESWRDRPAWTAASLLAADFPPLRWVVADLLPEGCSLLVGAPKVGKSWAALDIGLAVACGGKALGGLDVEQGEVLYLALEDGPRRLADRTRLLLDPSSPPPSALTVYFDWSRGSSAVAEAAEWLDAHPSARLVVVDVLAKVRPRRVGGGDRYADDYGDLSPWQRLATKYRVAVLLVHHDRKADASDFVDAVSGTHGIAGSADSVLLLTRDRMDQYGCLSLTGRDITREREVGLVRAGPAWIVHDGPVPDANLGDRSREVLAEVDRLGEASPADVATALGVAPNAARVYLGRLVGSGRLTKRGRGSYALPNATDATDATAEATR